MAIKVTDMRKLDRELMSASSSNTKTRQQQMKHIQNMEEEWRGLVGCRCPQDVVAKHLKCSWKPVGLPEYRETLEIRL